MPPCSGKNQVNDNRRERKRLSLMLKYIETTSNYIFFSPLIPTFDNRTIEVISEVLKVETILNKSAVESAKINLGHLQRT